jgi:uncharacterized protein (TIGR03435 family)
MHDATDMDLLRQYAGGNSDAAFAALVSRHVNLVYSAALRKAGNPHAAEEITQAVFIILAQKAGRIPGRTILPGWLYQTARLTAASFLKREIRRVRREQEAYMLSQTDSSRRSETEADEIWQQLAPLLEDAMGQLGDKDRAAVVLRFFGGKSFAEVAAVAGVSENAAKKRVGHALEKLRKFFMKRGIASTAETIAGAISANSIQAAPVALAKSITAVAVLKGAAASTSTLTLIKGALKLMAWTKAKTAVVVGVGVLLAAGTTTITVKEIQEHRTYWWEEVPDITPVNLGEILASKPPQVIIKPAKFSKSGGGSEEVDSNDWISVGISATADGIVRTAYGSDRLRTVFLAKVPEGRFDFIANLPHGSSKALQVAIKRKFGLVGKREIRETDVLLLKLAAPDTGGFKPANSLRRSLNVTAPDTHNFSKSLKDGSFFACFDRTLEESGLRSSLETAFQLPIIDQTGLTNRYDFSVTWPAFHDNDNEKHKQITRGTLLDQLGLELVPSREPIEMLVVEKAK